MAALSRKTSHVKPFNGPSQDQLWGLLALTTSPQKIKTKSDQVFKPKYQFTGNTKDKRKTIEMKSANVKLWK